MFKNLTWGNHESNEFTHHLQYFYLSNKNFNSPSPRKLSSDINTRPNWQSELRQTNDVIMDSLEVASSVRRLCRHGRAVTRVLPGSVLLRLRCPRLTSLDDLTDMHQTGELHQVRREGKFGPDPPENCHLTVKKLPKN